MKNILTFLLILVLGALLQIGAENCCKSPSKSFKELHGITSIEYRNDTMRVHIHAKTLTKKDLENLLVIGKLNNLKIYIDEVH